MRKSCALLQHQHRKVISRCDVVGYGERVCWRARERERVRLRVRSLCTAIETVGGMDVSRSVEGDCKVCVIVVLNKYLEFVFACASKLLTMNNKSG